MKEVKFNHNERLVDINMKYNLLLITEEISSGIHEFIKILEYIKNNTSTDFKYIIVLDTDVNVTLINNSNNILLFRSRSLLHLEIAKMCRKINKPIFLFLDDDFLGLSETSGKLNAGIWPARKYGLRTLLSIIDGIVVCNDFLAEKYSKMGNINRIIKINSSVKNYEINYHFNNYNNNKLVYYVNDGTTDYFYNYLEETLILLGKKHPNVFTIDLYSLKPDCSRIKGVKVNYIKHMPYPNFTEALKNGKYLLGFAALDDIGFNKYKYINKFFEYSKAGILGIYSDCILYRTIINNNNGILVENTPEKWVEAIISMRNDPDLHDTLLKNAQSDLSKHFDVGIVATKFIKDMPELINNNLVNEKLDVNSDIILKYVHYSSKFKERLFLIHRYYEVGGISLIMKALYYFFERKREKY